MKNIPDGINRLEIAEEKVDECEGTAIETIQNKTQGEKNVYRNEKSIHELQENFMLDDVM